MKEESVNGSEAMGVKSESLEKLLTTAEVAQLLGCSERHLRNLWKRGQFPAPIYLGRLVRHRREDVRRFLEERASAAGKC